jgi:hypothetical protein
MASEEIPTDIRVFIARYLRSVGHLELMLFLFDGRDREWTAIDLAKEMRTNESLVEQQVSALNGPIKKTKIIKPEAFRFEAADKSLLELVAKLSSLYRSHRHAIISEVYSQPLATIQSFADAFKIKKD